MRRIIAAILACAALTGVSALFASSARADGDPASDVLVYKPVFNPPDSGASADQIAELTAVVQAADKAGYPIKVALVNSSQDLGTVTELWEEATPYAQYLGKELSYQFKGVVLVVMPQTDGLYVPHKVIPPGDSKAMSGLNPAGSDLADAATAIVKRLAGDNGITLPTRYSLDPAVAAPKHGSSALVPIIGFLVGLAVLIGAWGASLRLRPPSRRRAVTPA